MGLPGLPELLVVFGVVVLLFGAQKIPKLFGAFGEGIKNFKKGLHSEDHEEYSDKLHGGSNPVNSKAD